MKKQDIYSELETKMVRYADLVGVPTAAKSEQLVAIEADSGISIKPINKEMLPYTGKQIFVRSEVLARLTKANNLLRSKNPDYQLQVVYGYRALSIQRDLFDKYKKQFQPQLSGAKLIETTHRLIASPNIAGHPTGGAVDIQIICGKKAIETGTKIWEFKKDSYTFSPFISKQATNNRMLLRKVMLSAGFAPFDGEWWHYSYGDKEWAVYYNKPKALYSQVEFAITK